MDRQNHKNSNDRKEFVWAVWIRDKDDESQRTASSEITASEIRASEITALEMMVPEITHARLVGCGTFPCTEGLSPADDFVIDDTAKMERIMTVLSQAETERAPAEDEISAFMKKVDHCIFNNLASPDILKETAKAVSFSEGYFCHLFKAMTGQSFKSYVKKKRLERARLYVRMTESRVSEIGESIGYPNPTYFSSVYKAYFNISPQEERRRMETWLREAAEQKTADTKSADLKMDADLL